MAVTVEERFAVQLGQWDVPGEDIQEFAEQEGLAG